MHLKHSNARTVNAEGPYSPVLTFATRMRDTTSHDLSTSRDVHDGADGSLGQRFYFVTEHEVEPGVGTGSESQQQGGVTIGGVVTVEGLATAVTLGTTAFSVDPEDANTTTFIAHSGVALEMVSRLALHVEVQGAVDYEQPLLVSGGSVRRMGTATELTFPWTADADRVHGWVLEVSSASAVAVRPSLSYVTELRDASAPFIMGIFITDALGANIEGLHLWQYSAGGPTVVLHRVDYEVGA